MFGITKTVVRYGLIGALVLGAGMAIAGPHRVKALFTQTREAINNKIDENITDPVALRAQLKSLEAQYPRRIAEVRGDLAKLREQVTQLNRDLSVSRRVVELADEDSAKLAAAIDHAHAAGIRTVGLESDSPSHEVVIRFKNDRLDVGAAQSRLNQIDATRNAYANRAVDVQRDLGYLSQQERQLSSLLTRLETEHTSFQTQLFDLERQIDAIGRNDRMIAIMADRQQTLDDQSRYRAASLDAITSKLADIRARQEATLASLGKAGERSEYEHDAKASLDREAVQRSRETDRAQPANRPRTIEIDASSVSAVVGPMLPEPGRSVAGSAGR
ncbi:MAG: hypothetical protein KF768_08700 [Phycisphaeraceae bacterium]|nr:hypothetical protein [Phycisphaeraceae bacterium]